MYGTICKCTYLYWHNNKNQLNTHAYSVKAAITWQSVPVLAQYYMNNNGDV